MMFLKNAMALVAVAILVCSATVESQVLQAVNTPMSLSSYVPGATGVSATVGFRTTSAIVAGSTINVNLVTEDVATTQTYQFDGGNTAAGTIPAQENSAGANFGLDLVSTLVPTMSAQPTVRAVAGWSASATFGSAVYTQFSSQRAMVSFTLTAAATSGESITDDLMIAIDNITLPSQSAMVVFLVTRAGSQYTPLNVVDTAQTNYPVGSLYINTTPLTASATVKVTATVCFSNVGVAGGTCADAGSLGTANRAANAFIASQLSGSLSMLHAWYSQGVAAATNQNLYVTFQDSAAIAVGDKIYVHETKLGYVIDTNIVSSPAVQSLLGAPATTTLTASASLTTASTLFISIVVGVTPIPANTLMRLSIPIATMPAAVTAELATLASGGVWVRTTKSGFRNGALPTVGATYTTATCTNFCTPVFAPAGTVIVDTATAEVYDAGAAVVTAAEALSVVTATQTTATPGAANMLTLTITTSTTANAADVITGSPGQFLYVYFPVEYASSMPATVSGASLVLCTSTTVCGSTDMLGGNTVAFDMTRLALPILSGQTFGPAASTVYRIVVPLTNPASAGSFTFQVATTTRGDGSTNANNGSPGAFGNATPLIVSSGSVVSGVTGAFANNTPAPATGANTLTVTFQDSATLPSGSTITVVLPSQFTSSIISSAPAVSGTGVTVSSASFSALTLTVTTASEVAANTAISLLIPTLASPASGLYVFSVATSMSPSPVENASPGISFGGTLTTSYTASEAAGLVTVTVVFSSSIDMPVGETISIIARKETALVTAASTQAGTVLLNFCNSAAGTAVDGTGLAGDAAPTLVSGWGSTTVTTTSCLVTSTGSTVDIMTISFTTATAVVPANTPVVFTYVNAGAIPTTISYSLSFGSSSAAANTAETGRRLGISTTLASLVPSASVTAPGAATILTITVGANLGVAATELYMPGFASSIDDTSAVPVTGAASAATFNAATEILSFTSTTATTFTVAIASLPTAGSYTFYLADSSADVAGTDASGITPFVVQASLSAFTASFSQSTTGAVNSKLTFTFASSGTVTPGTAIALNLSNSGANPSAFLTGIATNPTTETVSGWGTVTIAAAVYDSSTQVITFTLGGSGSVAVNTLLTSSVVVSTMPATGGEFTFSLAYSDLSAVTTTTTVLGVVSDLVFSSSALTASAATTYTLVMTSSRAAVESTSTGGVTIQFGQSSDGATAFTTTELTGTAFISDSALVLGPTGDNPPATDALNLSTAFNAVEQTLTLPYVSGSFAGGVVRTIRIIVNGGTCNTPATAGSYPVMVKTGGSPTYVAAAVPLTIGGASSVTATTSSTISGSAATLTIGFTPPASLVVGSIVTVSIGAFGDGIVAAPTVTQTGSGWGSTTVTSVAYAAASSQLVFTVATATVSSAVTMTVAVASNPEAGSRHFVGVETSLAPGVVASSTAPIIVSGTPPLAVVTSVSPSTFDGSLTTTVTLTGTGFGLTTSQPTVTFGATGVESTCSSATWVSATSITCIVAGVTGQSGSNLMFIVAINGIAGTAGGSLTLTTTQPSITGVSPTSGPANTGVVVTLTGVNLEATTSVTMVSPTGVSGLICAPLTVVSSTELTCTTSNNPASGVHTFIAVGPVMSSDASSVGYEYGVVAPTPTPVAAPTPTPVAAPTPTPVAAPTPTPVAAPTPTPDSATPGSEPADLGDATSYSETGASATKEYDATSVHDSASFTGVRSAVLNCNQFSGIPSDAIVVKVTLGIYSDYFKPAGGQSLCDLLTGAYGSFYLHSASPSGPFSAVQSVDPRRLGGAGDTVSGAQGRSSTGNDSYSGIGPYWGVRTVGSPGACGHEAAGDEFHCGIAFTMSVSVLNFYSRYAFINGFNVLSENTYLDGVTASAASADDIRSCKDYDNVPFGNIVVKLTMGEFVDYVKPLQTLCSLMASKSPNPWFYHAWSEDGPWTLRWGNHDALLGGWNVYGTDLDIVSAVDSDGVTRQRQRREWGTFWGAPAVGGYTAEPGACCHASAGQQYQFFQKLTIDVKVLAA